MMGLFLFFVVVVLVIGIVWTNKHRRMQEKNWKNESSEFATRSIRRELIKREK
jgi:hypothetical protein